jgi:hypothetical protein
MSPFSSWALGSVPESSSKALLHISVLESTRKQYCGRLENQPAWTMTAMCKQPGLNMQGKVDRSCILGSLFVRKTGSKPDGCQMWLLGYPARIRVQVCGLAVGGRGWPDFATTEQRKEYRQCFHHLLVIWSNDNMGIHGILRSSSPPTYCGRGAWGK